MLLKQSKSQADILNSLRTTATTMDSHFYNNMDYQKNSIQNVSFKAEQSFTILQDFIKTSKRTVETLSSLAIQRENSIHKLDESNNLDFTFYDINTVQKTIVQAPVKKTKLKFSHSSLYSVLLYTLLFNHIHLSTLKNRLPKIQKQSLRTYNIIKKYLSLHDHEFNALGIYSHNISIHALLRIIQDASKDTQGVKNQLKNMINRLDQRCTLEVYTSILKDLREQARKDIQHFQPNRETEMLAFNNQQKNIEQFATLIGIGINIMEDQRNIQFGKSNSCICVSIKRLKKYQKFCLKKISCFEEGL